MTTPQALPDPETIRRTAIDILQGPEFHVNQYTQVGGTIVDLLRQIFVWIILPFRWLFEAMEGLPDVLRWLIVIGLFVLLMLLVGHIVYSLVTVLRPSTRNAKFVSALSSNRILGAEEFEQLAQEAIAQHDYIAAVRFLFRASLSHLQILEGRLFSPGLTNRQFLRRYQKSPIAGSLQSFVEIIDASWYGNGECRREDYLKCRQAYAKIRLQTKEDTHADGA